MSGDNRLPPPYGTLIDRERLVDFSFEGAPYSGLAGDCIASALAANDHWLLSRSFKYRRPRGVLTMAGQDANTLVQIGAENGAVARRAGAVPADVSKDTSRTTATKQRSECAVIGAR